MAYTLRSIDIVSAKRHNTKWLSRKMVKRRGDGVSRALAGSLLAASEEDWSTVSEKFKNQLFENASYLRRGNGKQGHQAAIQNHTNHRLRLLLWDEHAKAGHYFFSWEGGFVYTGTVANVPKEWVEWSLKGSPLGFARNGSWIHWEINWLEEALKNREPTKSGWISMSFNDGTELESQQRNWVKRNSHSSLNRSWYAASESSCHRLCRMGLAP